MKLITLPILPALLCASTYYVTPYGTPQGNGSQTAPWDLQTAFNQPLASGDVLQLVGLFSGAYTSSLGSVTISGYGARLDGWLTLNGPGGTTLDGLEIFNSNSDRTTITADAIYAGAPNLKILHCIIHDVHGNGIGFWSGAPNSVASGNIIYFNGYNASDRGHGHGMYIQSAAPATKLIENNIVFDQFGWGLHSYTEGGNIDNITYRGNIAFNAGALATVPCSIGTNNNLLTGGLQVAQSPVWDSNYTYFPNNSCRDSALGYSAGTANAHLISNWFVGSTPFFQAGTNSGLVQTGSVAYDWTTGKHKAPPPALACFVRADTYKTGWGIAAVFNLSGSASSVSCDVSALGLVNGAQLSVVSTENYFGPGIMATAQNGRISIPLTGWTVATPIGWTVPASALPKFGAFVLR